MFHNLKKKINSLGANSPTLRAASFADGDGPKREANDSQTKETLAEGESTLPKHPRVGDFSSGETAGSGRSPLARPDDGTDPDALRVTTKSASKDVHSLEMPPSASGSSATVGVDVQKTNSAAFSLEDFDNAADAQIEDSRDISTLDLDCLRQRCCHLQDRSNLYKSRLQQAVAAHRITEAEKEQLQANLTQALDKHRRQLSELNEQIMLDSHAKRDLENNYALMLDEKDEMIQVLRMKIKLLKDGNTGDAGNSMGSSAQEQAIVSESTSDASETQLKEKVRRLELLLTRCKDTIRTNKEKMQQLDLDRASMSKLAQEKTEELDKFKEHSEKTVLDLQRLLTAAEGKLKTQDDSDQNKKTCEIEMDRMASLESQNKMLQETVAKLEKAGQQQLDKSREIIRQLKEQKRQLEEKIQYSEDSNHTITQDGAGHKVEVSEEKDQSEMKIKELLEVNEKNKTEFEKKLNELTLQHSTVVDNFEEKLRAEAQKVAKLEAEHRTQVNALAIENEILTKASEEFKAKAEEMNALLEKNCQLENQLKVILDSDKQDDLRRQIAELDKTVKKWKFDFRDQNEKFFTERQSLQERVKELEAMVDNQREIFRQETDLMKADIEEKQSSEMLLKVAKYEDGIQHLRREIEAKNIHTIGEVSSSSVTKHPDTCQSHESVEAINLFSENLVDEQKQVNKLPVLDDQSAVGLQSEVNLVDIHDVPDSVASRLEMENLKLKETNALLMDENTTSKSLILDFEKTISILMADAELQQNELSQRLASSTEVVAQLEQRINDSTERENQLNMDLETAKIENEQTVALQGRKIISLNETIEKLTKSEQLLQESLQESHQQIKALQDMTDDSGKLANDEITTLKSLIDRLKISEESLEKTNALLNEEMRTLKDDFDGLCSSKKILEDANISLSAEINLLKTTVEQLRDLEQAAKDASASNIEEINSLSKIIEDMKSSEQLTKAANASLNDELISCKGVAEQLRVSEQISKETVSSQNEEINSLKAAIDRLKSSEATLLDRNSLQLQELKDIVNQEKGSVKILNDTVASQAEEINSLKTVIDQMKASEKMHLEENASLNNDLSVLRDSILQLKNEEMILKEANILQNEEINSLKETIGEMKTSETALVTAGSSQSEEISALKMINEDIRSSEQNWKDAFSSKSAEMRSLQVMIEQFQRSELALKETIALKSNELSLMNSWNPMHSFYPAVDNVQKSLAKKQNLLRLEVEESPDLNGTGLHVFKVKESCGGHLAYQKDLAFEMESEAVIKKLEAEIELLNLRLHEKEQLQKHFDTEKHVLLEKLEAMENFDTSDQKAEIELRLELDHLEEKAQHGLEIISFMEQVKHLEEEIILMKQSHIRSPLLASVATSPLEWFSRNKSLQDDDNAEHLKQKTEKVREHDSRFDDGKEESKSANENLDVFLAENAKDDGRTELATKHAVDEKISRDLEWTKNLNHDADKNLLISSQDVREIERKSAEEKDKEKSDKMQSEIFHGMEVFGFQTASQSVEYSGLGHSGECSDLDSNQNLLELDKEKNAPGEDVESKDLKRQKIIELYESRISDFEQTQGMLQEDLTVLMEKFNAVTDRCSKAEKDAEHYKWLALENGGNKAGILSELNSENEAKALVVEVADLKLKLEESRTELEHLQQKLQYSENQGPLQNMKESESCLSLGSGGLVTSKSECGVTSSSLSANLLMSEQKGAFLPANAATLAACSGLTESGNSSELEMPNASKTDIAENTALCFGSEATEFELVKRRFESELSSLRNRYEDEVVNMKIKNEESIQFYEMRIADLEQTSMMLREDVTVLVEKLNVLKEQCVAADKTAHHYKLLVQEFESKGNRELEQEPKTSKGEDAFLKEQIRKDKKSESQHLAEISRQEKAGERLVSGSIEETCFEKQVDVDSGSQFSGVREKTASQSQTFVLPAHADRKSVSEFDQNSLRLGNFGPLDQTGDQVNLATSSIPQEYSNISIQNPERDEIEKIKLEFKSELRKYSIENTNLKTIQKELMDEVNSLKSSIQVSLYGNSKLYVSESTELEYLRHILYKYMLGMETKTLAKVICTVVKFSPEETRKVLDREDARAKIFPSTSR